eukprot:6260102-Amphidinium_carterae.1
MPPSWVWNRTCSHCHIHVCCKHSKEKVTLVYSPLIVTAEGDAERHIPIGSSHSFYCGENVRILCTTCTKNQQDRIDTVGGQDLIPFEQRVYLSLIHI